MTFKPEFSIVLPVRNGGHLFKLCVQSILNQEYPFLKLHVLDNASSDGSLEWIREIADERVVIYPSVNSLSIEENWKRILDIEANEYLSLIGHDDILHPDFLSTMVAMIRENQDASLFYAHFDFVNAKGEIIRSARKVAPFLSPPLFVKSVLNLNIDITGTGFVFRAKDYAEVGGIPGFPKLLFADYALWIALANKGNGIAIAPKKTFQFRLHENTSQKSSTSFFCTALNEFIIFLSETAKHTNDSFSGAIKVNAPFFIEYYTRSLSNRMIREQLSDRNGLTVKDFVETIERATQKLTGSQAYRFPRTFFLKVGISIDNLPAVRNIYRGLRKLLLKY